MNKPTSQVSIELGEKIIRRKTFSETLQHPATLFTAAICLISGGYLLLLAPMFGGSAVAIVIASISGVAAVGSYCFCYPKLYQRNTRYLTERFDIEREQIEQNQLNALRKTIISGFTGISSSEGLDVLNQLSHEYEELKTSLNQQRHSDPISISVIPALAEETYLRGLGVLSDTLELMNIVQTPVQEKLEKKIAEVERDIQLLEKDQSQLDWLKLKQEVLASFKEKLTNIGTLNLWIEQLLYQARRCEATLRASRVELAKIRAGGVKSDLDSIIKVLEERIRQVKEVQDELNRLGY